MLLLSLFCHRRSRFAGGIASRLPASQIARLGVMLARKSCRKIDCGQVSFCCFLISRCLLSSLSLLCRSQKMADFAKLSGLPILARTPAFLLLVYFYHAFARCVVVPFPLGFIYIVIFFLCLNAGTFFYLGWLPLCLGSTWVYSLPGFYLGWLSTWVGSTWFVGLLPGLVGFLPGVCFLPGFYLGILSTWLLPGFYLGILSTWVCFLPGYAFYLASTWVCGLFTLVCWLSTWVLPGFYLGSTWVCWLKCLKHDRRALKWLFSVKCYQFSCFSTRVPNPFPFQKKIPALMIC
jgi:hypothetical protein